jgi:hypothetical protein
VPQRRGGGREAHRAHLGGQAGVAALEADGAQPAADPVRLVDDRLETHLHQFVRGDQAGEPAADHRDLGAVFGRRYLAETRGVGEEIVVRVREVRTEHGDRRLRVGVLDGCGHRGRHEVRTPCTEQTGESERGGVIRFS